MSVIRRSGRIRQGMMIPRTQNPIAPAKGKVQFPVASTTQANTMGEMIPATAEAPLGIPLAVPVNCGAMSIGTAQIGPIVNSLKKDAPARHAVTVMRLWLNKSGARNASPPSKLMAMTFCLAATTLPVRGRISSLITPPAISPSAPRKTPPRKRTRNSRFAKKCDAGLLRNECGSQVHRHART